MAAYINDNELYKDIGSIQGYSDYKRNKPKGLWFQNKREYDKRRLLDRYKRDYLELDYTLTSHPDYEGKADHELTVAYKSKRFRVEDELKNWEQLTKNGRPSKVTGLNYNDKVGNKNDWNSSEPDQDTYRTVTFRHPNGWQPRALAYANRDKVEIHTPKTWDSWLKAIIKAVFGLEYPRNAITRGMSSIVTLRSVLRTLINNKHNDMRVLRSHNTLWLDLGRAAALAKRVIINNIIDLIDLVTCPPRGMMVKAACNDASNESSLDFDSPEAEQSIQPNHPSASLGWVDVDEGRAQVSGSRGCTPPLVHRLCGGSDRMGSLRSIRMGVYPSPSIIINYCNIMALRDNNNQPLGTPEGCLEPI